MIRRITTALLGAVLLSGCAGSHFDVERFRTDVVEGDYEGALAVLEDGAKEDDVSDLLDRGLVLSELGRYTESNEVLERAERLIDDLYTRSLSREALSLLTSDNALDYRAAGFEHAYIAYYRAWNYLELGQPEGAIVEARKINERLGFRSDTCPDEDGACGHHAFLRWFSGLLFEWDGRLNDAYIAYRQADLAVPTMRERFGIPPPADLGRRLVRLALALGFDEDARRYAEAYDLDPGAVAPPRGGEVIVLLENGIVGRRVEESLTVPIFSGETHRIATDVDGWSGRLSRRVHVDYSDAELEYILRIAVPSFRDTPPPARGGRATVGPASGELVPVDRVSARAKRALDDAMGGILVRTIARGLTKYLARETAEKEIGQGAGLLVNILGAATERADVRSWRSLPHDILAVTLEVPEGTWEAELEIRGAAGGAIERVRFPDVAVEPGGMRFIRHRVLR